MIGDSENVSKRWKTSKNEVKTCEHKGKQGENNVNLCIHFYLILLQLARKREKLPLERRFQAIGEELAGFFLREVIPEFGEYHHSP